jgi:hypothetical protein
LVPNRIKIPAINENLMIKVAENRPSGGESGGN